MLCSRPSEKSKSAYDLEDSNSAIECDGKDSKIVLQSSILVVVTSRPPGCKVFPH